MQATVVETTVDGEQKVESYVGVSAPPFLEGWIFGPRELFYQSQQEGRDQTEHPYLGDQGQGLHVSTLKCWESESTRLDQLSVCLIGHGHGHGLSENIWFEGSLGLTAV